MADTSAPATPFPGEDASPLASETADPLEGDWSEGLRGPLRAHGIAPPRRLSLEDLAQASTGSTNGAAAPAPEHASGAQLEAPSEAAPTPWSEPVAGPSLEDDGSASGAVTGWDQAAAPPGPADAVPVAPPAGEWQMQDPATDPTASATLAEEQAAPPEAWSATPQEQTWGAAAPAAKQPGWNAAAPAPVDSEWTPPAPAAAPEWSAPPAAAAEEWEVPITEVPPDAEAVAVDSAPPPRKPAWNQAAVGATALEQLDSQPPEPEPGAAKELFGSVPAGATLGAADDELGPPEELAAPEEVLKPVAIDHDDPDLPQSTGEPARTRAQPLAAWRPTAANALEMQGEHRVAVHTRGGRTLRGTMRDIDLSKSQFPLIPQGGGEPEPIYRADVKAIFFMLAPGEPPHAGDGAKVRVTFADGRAIEGIRDGADAKHGFFLVPLDAARTNTRCIYVAREATSDIKDG